LRFHKNKKTKIIPKKLLFVFKALMICHHNQQSNQRIQINREDGFAVLRLSTKKFPSRKSGKGQQLKLYAM